MPVCSDEPKQITRLPVARPIRFSTWSVTILDTQVTRELCNPPFQLWLLEFPTSCEIRVYHLHLPGGIPTSLHFPARTITSDVLSEFCSRSLTRLSWCDTRACKVERSTSAMYLTPSYSCRSATSLWRTILPRTGQGPMCAFAMYQRKRFWLVPYHKRVSRATSLYYHADHVTVGDRLHGPPCDAEAKPYVGNDHSSSLSSEVLPRP
ncbi:hypothetical protein C7974DRAFT_84453 [Boeremia exigua]|uniref:uncharacterized protein n=1 Tax=Boeremia exigua TaxID=749465 RepID=UPI001E8CFF82|nr:uncharacterized protein C7974DRAFT_84453 [Boeremia exigua]KAH6612729.1 hypothetical protein C7974DRAFT_84453 [Boeremia exigua]